MSNSLELIIKTASKLEVCHSLITSLDILKMNSGEIEELIKKNEESNPLLQVHRSSYRSDDDSYDSLLNITESTSSYEELEFQINCISGIPSNIRSLAQKMVFMLDERGFLTKTVDYLAKYLLSSLEDIREALKVLKQLEPKGIGAKNLDECFLLQLDKNYKYHRQLSKILSNNELTKIAYKEYDYLNKKYNLTNSIVNDMMEYITTLSPSPIKNITPSKTNYIIPDLVFDEKQERVILNENNNIELSINEYYKSLLQTGDKNTKSYLRQNMNEAMLLIGSIHRRNQTLLEVSNEIVKYQRDFFIDGKKLKPMRLVDIAEILKVDKSTISRAISQKYLLTKHGTISLKSLFTNGVFLQGEADISTFEVKKIIRQVVYSEDKNNPLSDQKITQELNKRGIDIKRRTVSKYRDELKIPSKRLRKIKL